MTGEQRGSYQVAVGLAPIESEYSQVRAGIDAATELLLSLQTEPGYWVGRLGADATLESDYILLQLWLYPPGPGGWNPPSLERCYKAARSILRRQTPTGGWNIFPGGPDNVSACVKAYAALKLINPPGSETALVGARRRILEIGGVEAANSYTKLYLSYFDLFDREKTPTIPPEVFLLEASSKINIYEISSWSRAILAPLAILGGKRAARPVPAGFTLREIFSGNEPARPKLVSWKSFFLWADRSLKIWERVGLNGFRQKSIDAAERWMLERFEKSDGLAAIFPSMMNSIMALTELGYRLDHPILQRELARFDNLIVENEHELTIQPCHSPVWDTAITSFALSTAHPMPAPRVRSALDRAGEWLLSKEVTQPGDWIVKNPGVKPGGWYFEFENEFYPDCDDTAKVLLALEASFSRRHPAHEAARERALRWLI